MKDGSRVVILNYMFSPISRYPIDVYVLYEIRNNKPIVLEKAAWNPDPSAPLITKFIW